MRTFKAFSFLLLFSLLFSACAGSGLEPPTQAATLSPAMTATPLQPTPSRATTQTPANAATPAGAWLSLSPAGGKPGDAVQIEGYNPNPPAQSDLQNSKYQTYTNVCWDGCQDGLQEQGIQTTWSQTDPGHFSLTFRVPSAPWLSAGGPHNLTAGDYPVSVQYLEPGATNCANPNPKGCMVEIQSTSPFHLQQSASGQSCQSQGCGTLAVSTAQGAPGATIQVSGWAPLLELFGDGSQMSQMSYSGYSLVLLPSPNAANDQNQFNYVYTVSQSSDGKVSASFQVPLTGQNGPVPPGTYTLGLNADALADAKSSSTSTGSKPTSIQPVLVATTQFTITPALSWAQLNSSAPLWIDPSASLLNPTIGIDPGNPARLAYCAAGAIKVSQDGGATWTSIPTGPVSSLADGKGYSIGFGSQNPQPICNTVVLDPSHPKSFYADFSAANKQYGAPPSYFLGFYTTDNGQTWQLAPTPPEQGKTPVLERFGGFRNAGQDVQVLYSGDASGQPDEAPPTLVEQTADGGQTWQAGSLACPGSGPCLQWGPAANGITGMGVSLPQFVMLSTDNGQSWSSTGHYVELHGNGPNQLAALSADTAVLISGDAQYPLLVTRDGGKTWQAYTLPSLPGASQSNGFQYNGLQILPDGSLVAMITVGTPGVSSYYVLAPSAQNWCKLTTPVGLTSFPALLQVAGNKVWWINLGDQNQGQVLQSAPLSEFSCK